MRTIQPNALIQINLLYKQGLAALSKEMERLVNLTIGDKLSLGHARDLRDYVKLLSEMKKAHEAIAAEKKAKKTGNNKAYTEEQLQALIGASPKL